MENTSCKIVYNDKNEYVYRTRKTIQENSTHDYNITHYREITDVTDTPVAAGDHIRTQIDGETIDDVVQYNRCKKLYLPRYGIGIGDLLFMYEIERLGR